MACAPAEHVHGILSTVLTLWTLALMASRHLALDFYMERGCIIRVNPVRAKLEFEYALCFLLTGKMVFLNRDVPCMLSCNCGF